MKNNVIKRILAVSLAAAMLTGTAAFTEIGTYIGTNISVSAAEATPESSFEYTRTSINDNDDVISIHKFIGTEKEVIIPREIDGFPVEIIDYEAFAGCSELTSITIPYGVTTIYGEAFKDCTKLTDVMIPDSVTDMHYGTFAGCTSLKSITIPDSVTDMGGTFNGCSQLTNVKLSNSLTEIGNYTFYGCKSLESLEIPNKVTIIGQNAFEGCTSLKSLALPEGVTEIGDLAFKDCMALTEMIIPDKVTFIGACTFEGCTALKKIKLSDNITEIIQYTFKDCTALAELNIPDKVDTIGYSAFEGCKSLKNITFPEGVKAISREAFKDCTALTEITIPSSVTDIGGNAFENCTGLISVTIPDIKKMGENIFKGCTGLKTIKIEGLRYIFDGVFEGCTGLTEITIPDSVGSIGVSAFSGCKNLTSVKFPDDIYICENAFVDCINLKSVVLPENIEYIASNALGYCNVSENPEEPKYEKIDGFVIYGYKGTWAQEYAEENDIDFVSIDPPEIIDEEFEVNLGKLAIGETAVVTPYVPYDIFGIKRDYYVDGDVKCYKGTEESGLVEIADTDVIEEGGTYTYKFRLTAKNGYALSGSRGVYVSSHESIYKGIHVKIELSAVEKGVNEFETGGYESLDVTVTAVVPEVIPPESVKEIDIKGVDDPVAGAVIPRTFKNGVVAYPKGFGYPEDVGYAILRWTEGTKDTLSINYNSYSSYHSSYVVGDFLKVNNNDVYFEEGKVYTVVIGVFSPHYMDETGDFFTEDTVFTIDGRKADVLYIEDGDIAWISYTFEPCKAAPETLNGDTNGDGKVNIADALLISRYDAGLTELKPEQITVSDVNDDGKVNIADALVISRYDAGLIDSFNK